MPFTTRLQTMSYSRLIYLHHRLAAIVANARGYEARGCAIAQLRLEQVEAAHTERAARYLARLQLDRDIDASIATWGGRDAVA